MAITYRSYHMICKILGGFLWTLSKCHWWRSMVTRNPIRQSLFWKMWLLKQFLKTQVKVNKPWWKKTNAFPNHQLLKLPVINRTEESRFYDLGDQSEFRRMWLSNALSGRFDQYFINHSTKSTINIQRL